MPKYLPQILKLYDISEPTECLKIHDGTDNNAFILTDKNGEKTVLREAKRTDENKSIEFETTLLILLEKEGIKSPRIIPTKDNEYFAVLDNTAYTLFSFIDGYHYEQTNPEILTKGVIETGGKALGVLHAHTKNLKIDTEKSVRTILTEFDRLQKLTLEQLAQFKDYEELLIQVKEF